MLNKQLDDKTNLELFRQSFVYQDFIQKNHLRIVFLRNEWYYKFDIFSWCKYCFETKFVHLVFAIIFNGTTTFIESTHLFFKEKLLNLLYPPGNMTYRLQWKTFNFTAFTSRILTLSTFFLSRCVQVLLLTSLVLNFSLLMLP